MKTIFVADDDALMREMLSRTLQNKNFRVKTFSSADELLERFAFEYPQLIVSDVQMPGMTGLELLESLRGAGSEVPVMLMSAHLTPEIESRAVALGVERLVAKPIKDFDGFIGAIAAVVGDDAPLKPRGLDRLKSGFLTTLAHDLRTPLTALKIALDNLFARKDGLTKEERRMAEISRRNVDRIIETVEHQLDLLNAELGELPVLDGDDTAQKQETDLETVR